MCSQIAYFPYHAMFIYQLTFTVESLYALRSPLGLVDDGSCNHHILFTRTIGIENLPKRISTKKKTK